MSFQDKVILVTGSSSGIGAAVAIKFAQEGAKVAIVGRNQEKLTKVAKKCGNPLVLVADVTKDTEAKRIVDETIIYFGKLDVLVNNAGIVTPTRIQDENTVAVYDQVMTTNVRSPVYLTHLVVPHIVKTKGNIVNVSSVFALHVISKKSYAYNVSKAALDHFTRSIAADLATSGVRVNSVNPGPVKTDIIENMGATAAQQAAVFENMKKMTALGRIAEPEEIADVVLFLASDKAKGITGSCFVTDNGTMVNTDI